MACHAPDSQNETHHYSQARACLQSICCRAPLVHFTSSRHRRGLEQSKADDASTTSIYSPFSKLSPPTRPRAIQGGRPLNTHSQLPWAFSQHPTTPRWMLLSLPPSSTAPRHCPRCS